MDEKSAAATPDADRGPAPQSVPGERRRRAQEMLSAQRQRLDRLENELPDEVQRLAEEIARELARGQAEQLASLHPGDPLAPAVDLQPQLDQLRQQLAARQGEIDQAAAQLEQARLEGGRLEHELRVGQSLLQEAQTQHDQRRIESAALSEQLADANAQLIAARERRDQLRREVADQIERFAAEQEETRAQRRRVARELKAQHARRSAELEQRKAELQALAATRHTQLETQLAASEKEAFEARARLNELGQTLEQRKAELQALAATGHTQLAAQLAASEKEAFAARARLNELGQTLEQRSEELAQARRKAGALESEAAELRGALEKVQNQRDCDSVESGRAAAAVGSDHQEELKTLRSERDSLAGKLAAAERKLSEKSKAEGDSRKKDDLQRRFEMAVDELREMKLANAELEAKMAKERAGGSARANDMGTGLDWEAQKQRLLASLEADDRNDETAVAERHTIEGTIRITDQIVAQKDQEIAELKRRLEAQTHLDSSSGRDEEVADVLDRDELIRQERETLRLAQLEWREKIGKAEIAISVERAKIARDRSELEEKLRIFQREQQMLAKDEPLPETGKKARGHWLTRLGLKELDEES